MKTYIHTTEPPTHECKFVALLPEGVDDRLSALTCKRVDGVVYMLALHHKAWKCRNADTWDDNIQFIVEVNE